MRLFSIVVILLISGCASVGKFSGTCSPYTYGKSHAELQGLVYLSGSFEKKLRGKLPESNLDVEVCWYVGREKLSGRTINRRGEHKYKDTHY